jgi:hypothetical protein
VPILFNVLPPYDIVVRNLLSIKYEGAKVLGQMVYRYPPYWKNKQITTIIYMFAVIPVAVVIKREGTGDLKSPFLLRSI